MAGIYSVRDSIIGVQSALGGGAAAIVSLNDRRPGGQQLHRHGG